MAGHSKWANIQHRKGRQDAKRGKLFTKLIREITVAARLGGGDAQTNPRLRTAIDNALTNNMTKENIGRAIKRGTGVQGGDNVVEVRYEGYAIAGVAIIIDCITDNKNRTVGELRHVLSKCGGNLGTEGSVAYLFNKIGLLSYPPNSDENVLIEIALEADADNIVSNSDGSIDIITAAEDFMQARGTMVAAGYIPQTAEITMQAENLVNLDMQNAQSMLRLLDMLEDLDDVQKIYSNANISDDILAQLS